MAVSNDTSSTQSPQVCASDNLRELRSTSGMSRRELLKNLQAHGVEMHTNSLRRIEDGEQPMKVHEAQAFAAIFNIGLEQFITQPINNKAAKVRDALHKLRASRLDLSRALDAYLNMREDLHGEFVSGNFPPVEQLEESKLLAEYLEIDSEILDTIKSMSTHFGFSI